MTGQQAPQAGDVPLAGGRMTSGIVRRGDQLLRPMGPWSPAVHEYLRHLEAAGFEGSPRVLGIEGDREVLTFIDGDVAMDPFWQPGHGQRLPPYARTEVALRAAAKLIRKLHVASSGFRPAITCCRFHPYPPTAGQFVSHGDLGPWNTVYRNGVPVAFIDWDAAQPVDPLADLADAAWTFVPLAPPGQLAEAGFDPLPDLPARLRTTGPSTWVRIHSPTSATIRASSATRRSGAACQRRYPSKSVNAANRQSAGSSRTS